MKNLIILLIITSLFSCTKDEPKQYSEWIIGGDTMRSNNFDFTIVGKTTLSHFTHNQDGERVFIEFKSSKLPSSGTFLLVRHNISNDYNNCVMQFRHNYKKYFISIHEEKYATAHLVNGKSQITLPETWYANGEDPNDSVIIQGIFNEP